MLEKRNFELRLKTNCNGVRAHRFGRFCDISVELAEKGLDTQIGKILELDNDVFICPIGSSSMGRKRPS